MTRGLVVSDFHLFSRRSVGEELTAELDRRLADCDVLVLNGDTFDFRWSRFSNEEATIQAALDWMTRLMDRHPDVMLYYILGNHDCLNSFRENLEKLAESRQQLHWREHRLQLGGNLFLHGDCANWKMDEAALARFRRGWSEDRPKGEFHKKLYDVVDSLGVCEFFHKKLFPAPIAVRRVAHHLDQVMEGWRNQIDHCFFGHTHFPFTDHDFDGVRFHNTGSAIRGLGFQPLNFAYESERVAENAA
ncbi:MAG: metallophosphoesterase [Verrucomicrobiota bacterium]